MSDFPLERFVSVCTLWGMRDILYACRPPSQGIPLLVESLGPSDYSAIGNELAIVHESLGFLSNISTC